jgi:predicted MPP superfamily phosphohydrolase
MNKLLNFFTLCCFVFITVSCITEKSLITESYSIGSKKINTDSRIKIVVLSDTHSQNFEEGGIRIITKVKNEEPDLIFLTGDIIDNVMPVYGSEILLYNLQNIAPIYYITGNHEYYNKNIEDVLDIIRRYNINILQDAWTEVEVNGNKIIIAGADDPARTKFYDKNYNWEQSVENAFSVLKTNDKYKILLLHRPNLFKSFTDCNFDLIVSGHTHGGQFRFPARNGVYAPNQGFFPKYGGGLYKIDDFFLIISRGITTERPRFPRIKNPPEVVVIEITE